MERGPSRAREILEAGRQEQPDSASIEYSFARLEARQGREDAALVAAHRALELASPDQREQLLADMRAHDALSRIRDRL